jgi:hypothetical protein
MTKISKFGIACEVEREGERGAYIYIYITVENSERSAVGERWERGRV